MSYTSRLTNRLTRSDLKPPLRLHIRGQSSIIQKNRKKDREERRYGRIGKEIGENVSAASIYLTVFHDRILSEMIKDTYSRFKPVRAAFTAVRTMDESLGGILTSDPEAFVIGGRFQSGGSISYITEISESPYG